MAAQEEEYAQEEEEAEQEARRRATRVAQRTSESKMNHFDHTASKGLVKRAFGDKSNTHQNTRKMSSTMTKALTLLPHR